MHIEITQNEKYNKEILDVKLRADVHLILFWKRCANRINSFDDIIQAIQLNFKTKKTAQRKKLLKYKWIWILYFFLLRGTQ